MKWTLPWTRQTHPYFTCSTFNLLVIFKYFPRVRVIQWSVHLLSLTVLFWGAQWCQTPSGKLPGFRGGDIPKIVHWICRCAFILLVRLWTLLLVKYTCLFTKPAWPVFYQPPFFLFHRFCELHCVWITMVSASESLSLSKKWKIKHHKTTSERNTSLQDVAGLSQFLLLIPPNRHISMSNGLTPHKFWQSGFFPRPEIGGIVPLSA